MKHFFPFTDCPIIQIKTSGTFGQSLYIKREDLLHPLVSGNKYRKLKYNLLAAKEQGCTTLLTFGGAFSNHIAAVAAAGREWNFETIGIIRGEELAHKIDRNPTFSFARSCGMRLSFVSREIYRQKNETTFLDFLKKRFGPFYLLPEGGTNLLAIKGCGEILTEIENDFDYICAPVGTGGTLAGLIETSKDTQQLIGFSALKGTFQSSEIAKYTTRTNYTLLDAYSFGGYGKIDQDLVRFINDFKNRTAIPLDPVYTGKMLFGIFDLLQKGFFTENSRILAVHTGGLQGIAGMNQKLKMKNLPIIE